MSAADDRYNHSEKGRARWRRYASSERGRASHARYNESEKGRAAQRQKSRSQRSLDYEKHERSVLRETKARSAVLALAGLGGQG